MKKMLYLGLILVLFSASFTAIMAQPTSTPELGAWSDDRIGININQLIVSEVIPEDVQALFSDIPDLTEGYDYVVVNLTVESINGIHLMGFGYEDEKCVLCTDDDGSYSVMAFNIRGFKFNDPHDITSYEIDENATIIMIFEVPKIENLEIMEVIYSYKTTLEETSESRGQISINLRTDGGLIPEFSTLIMLLTFTIIALAVIICGNRSRRKVC
jgi:hypothetical protein